MAKLPRAWPVDFLIVLVVPPPKAVDSGLNRVSKDVGKLKHAHEIGGNSLATAFISTSLPAHETSLSIQFESLFLMRSRASCESVL